MSDPALRILHQDIDLRVRNITTASNGWPCRQGCDACCRSLHRQPVLTEPEWHLMEPALTTELRDRILSADGKICPLLNAETGACLVYDVRPVACRTYGFYVDREGGLYCSEIAERKGLEEIVWGNGEAVERRLDELGPRLSLPEWIVRSGRWRSSDHRQEAPPVSG